MSYETPPLPGRRSVLKAGLIAMGAAALGIAAQRAVLAAAEGTLPSLAGQGLGPPAFSAPAPNPAPRSRPAYPA